MAVLLAVLACPSRLATYTGSSVIFVAQSLCVVFGRWLAYQESAGREDLQLCFTSSLIKKLIWYIGMIYAMGDIFEMESVNYYDSATYTVLSRTAQKIMQWFILFTTSAGMLEYVLVGKA